MKVRALCLPLRDMGRIAALAAMKGTSSRQGRLPGRILHPQDIHMPRLNHTIVQQAHHFNEQVNKQNR